MTLSKKNLSFRIAAIAIGGAGLLASLIVLAYSLMTYRSEVAQRQQDLTSRSLFIWTNFERDRIAGNWTKLAMTFRDLLQVNQAALLDEKCHVIEAVPSMPLRGKTSCNDPHIWGQAEIIDLPSSVGSPIAKLAVFQRHEVWASFAKAFRLIMFLMVTVGISLHFTLRRLISKSLSEAIKDLLSSNGNDISSVSPEFLPAAQTIARYKEQQRLVVKQQTDLAIAGSMNELASQVAHDIRSPLAALGMILRDLGELPEEKRILIRSAITRIKDIANNLLARNKNQIQQMSLFAPKDSSPNLLLSGILDSILTEKRLQYRSNLAIEIDSAFDRSSYSLFAALQLTDFKRVISNLVNNSVEALNGNGKITVGLFVVDDEWLSVTVEDNGPGIPPQILAQLGQRGASFGKEGTESGSGLGLYHARSTIESWGGRFAIESKIGRGTKIRIELKRSKPPNWFMPELRLIPNQHVVVLDDDNSVHQIWDERFECAALNEARIQVHHFSTPEQLKEFVSKNRGLSTTFLCDFELLGFSESGIDLIEHLGIEACSALVTSRFEEQTVLERCLRAKVSMIPKGMASIVPIRIEGAMHAP